MTREDPRLQQHQLIEGSDLQVLDDPESILLPVLKRVGYAPEAVSEVLRERTVGLIGAGLAAIRVGLVDRMAGIRSWAGGRILAGDLCIESARWSRLLNGMRSPEVVYCFVLTLGEGFDDLTAERRSDSLFDAYVLDALGSHAAECLADRVAASIAGSAASKGYEWSHRFSPGYCDWNLEHGQSAIFQFLEPETIGMRKLPSGVMVPAKSLSAVTIGARHVETRSPCGSCKDTGCEYRRPD